jgi:hypothetical protein
MGCREHVPLNAVERQPCHQNHLNQGQHNIVQDVVELEDAGQGHLLLIMMDGGSSRLEWQLVSVGQTIFDGCSKRGSIHDGTVLKL